MDMNRKDLLLDCSCGTEPGSQKASQVFSPLYKVYGPSPWAGRRFCRLYGQVKEIVLSFLHKYPLEILDEDIDRLGHRMRLMSATLKQRFLFLHLLKPSLDLLPSILAFFSEGEPCYSDNNDERSHCAVLCVPDNIADLFFLSVLYGPSSRCDRLSFYLSCFKDTLKTTLCPARIVLN